MAGAQENANLPCQNDGMDQFDFWVGEWQVLDTKTGKLTAYDRISKELKGCILMQRWTQLNDDFRSTGAPHRLRGMSVTGWDGSQWIQTWVDNMGGTIVLKGSVKDNKAVLQTYETSYGWHYRYHIDANPDGTVHYYGYSAREGTNEWVLEWDLTYVSNE
jgi:hypothetical protein